MSGSIWRKWDLHFHTPSSFDYGDKSITDQEIIDILVSNRVSVIAITDHHIIDIKRIKNLQKIGTGKITVLPGIELRSELGGSESIHYIGIFPENADLNHIWTNIQATCKLTEKDINERGGHQKLHCDLKDTCSLIHNLGGIVSVHAGGKTNSIESIKNNHEYKQAIKKELVSESIDIFELGTPDDEDDYNQIVFPAIKMRKPMIICSDNHNIHKYSVKQNLWIKADPTFQGLKQIIFEPKHRVVIEEHPPIAPPLRIEKVKFGFPENSKIVDEAFCLSGTHEIVFSPNFTCLIGGRGSGKSTILNLIHERLKPGENKFFGKYKIRDKNSDILPISKYVSVDDDSDEKFIEFLSQNEIEEFALNYSKLTNAIYNRIIKRDSQGAIKQCELLCAEEFDSLKEHVHNLTSISKLNHTIKQKIKELETNRKVVDSFTSKEYKEIVKELNSLTNELNTINNSKKQFADIIEDISSISAKYTSPPSSNLYSKEIAKLLVGIQELILSVKSTDFTPVTKVLADLIKKIDDKTKDLNSYLSSKGLTQENLYDIRNSNQNILALEMELEKLNNTSKKLEEKIKKYNSTNMIQAGERYKKELEKQINPISEMLEVSNNGNVKPISLELIFDSELAKQSLFNDFKEIFEEHLRESKHKGDGILYELLFSFDLEKLINKKELMDAISSYGTNSVAKPFLIELFSDDLNFELFNLFCKGTFANFPAFKRIRVFYDNRPIEDSSFGQRCTAVLVILLLLGNNPIIIDEPEAHLDSLLISNYLVDVIKDGKSNRQIIFATHNANFVINGDAELIHILTSDPTNNLTKVASTTIENESQRDTLVNLEGGKEAFKRREGKYQLY
jgi:exonuclease SbcC